MNRSSVLSRARFAAAVATAAALVVGLAACGDDGDGGDDENGQASGPPTTTEPTTTTQPSATEDEEAAFEAVREGFDERQQLIDELFTEPSLLDDPEPEQVQRLRELVTGDLAQSVDATAEFAERLANRGRRLRAAGEVLFDWGIYRMEATGADTITFEACVIRDSVEIDEAGEVVPGSGVVLGQFGVGEAHRVDGAWRLHQMTRDTDLDITEDDRTPGTLHAGACDDEFGEGSEEES